MNHPSARSLRVRDHDETSRRALSAAAGGSVGGRASVRAGVFTCCWIAGLACFSGAPVALAGSQAPADQASPNQANSTPAAPVKAETKAEDDNHDKITLSDGRTLAGQILKETSETIWLDVGFDVLSVPRNRVAEIVRADADAALAKQSVDVFFRTATGLPESTPQELAQRIGEAVIKVSTPSGLGSGFIIDPEGYAITNAHVIQGETDIAVTVFQRGEREFSRLEIRDVEIIATNDHLDLALIRFNHPRGLPFSWVYVQGEENLEAGESTFAIGSPLGLERTLSQGVIATTQRNFEGLTFIQTTAEINPGNSGGPLFNLRGEAIGVTNMKIPFGEGMGFAIPARYVRDFLRNHEAFAYSKENPNSGHNYKRGPLRTAFGTPPMLRDANPDAH